MLIKFETRSAPPMLYFGEVGRDLLRMMGRTGDVPGAMLDKDVASALQRLQSELAERAGPLPAVEESDSRSHASLERRAYPLIQLLSSAARNRSDVTWMSV